MGLGTFLALAALSLPPVGPVGLPGSGLTRVSGESPLVARACYGPGAQRGSEVEPSVAAGPGGLLAVAWQQDRYVPRAAAGIGVSVSRDGGASWAVADIPGLTGCLGPRRPASDPWVSIGGDGRIWAVALRVRLVGDDGLESKVAIASSVDGGSTWSAPALLDAGGFNDKPSLSADPGRAGVAYAVWTRDASAFFSRTVDGGSTWSPPRLIRRAPRGGGTVSSTISVLPDGALLHAYMRYGRGGVRIETARSDDGGASWSEPAEAARVGELRTRSPAVRALPISGTGPAVARSGAVFEAFVKQGGSAIAVSGSSDGGRRWSGSRVVVRHPRGLFGPTLAAGGGELGLSYYAREPGGRASFWIARSSDARRWVTRRMGAPFLLSRAPRADDDVFLGDYTGLAAAPGGGFVAAFSAPPPLASAGRADVLVSRP